MNPIQERQIAASTKAYREFMSEKPRPVWDSRGWTPTRAVLRWLRNHGLSPTIAQFVVGAYYVTTLVAFGSFIVIPPSSPLFPLLAVITVLLMGTPRVAAALRAWPVHRKRKVQGMVCYCVLDNGVVLEPNHPSGWMFTETRNSWMCLQHYLERVHKGTLGNHEIVVGASGTRCTGAWGTTNRFCIVVSGAGPAPVGCVGEPVYRVGYESPVLYRLDVAACGDGEDKEF